MNYKFITTFYNTNEIDTVAYTSSVLPLQTKGKILYHENNYPFKMIEEEFYDTLRDLLIGKPIGYEHIYFDEI